MKCQQLVHKEHPQVQKVGKFAKHNEGRLSEGPTACHGRMHVITASSEFVVTAGRDHGEYLGGPHHAQ